MEDLRDKFQLSLKDEQLGLFLAKEFSEDLEDCMLDNLNPIQYGLYISWKEAEFKCGYEHDSSRTQPNQRLLANQPEPSICANTITDSGVSTCDDVLNEIKSLREEMKVFQSNLLSEIIKKMNEMEKRMVKSAEKEKMFYDQGSQTDEIAVDNRNINNPQLSTQPVSVQVYNRPIPQDLLVKKQVSNPASQKIVQMQSAIEQDLLKLQAELGEMNYTANKIKMREKIQSPPPVSHKPFNLTKRRLGIDFPSSLSPILCEEMKVMKVPEGVDLQVDKAMRFEYSVIHIRSQNVEEILNLAYQIWNILKSHMTEKQTLDDPVVAKMFNSWSRWERLLFQINCSTAIGYQPAMRFEYSVIHIRSQNVEEILNLAYQIWNILKSHMTEKQTLDDPVVAKMFNSWSRWERLLFQINCSTAIGYQPDTFTWSLYSWDTSLIDASRGRATTLQIAKIMPSEMFNFSL